MSDGGAVARQGEKRCPLLRATGTDFSGCHPWHVRSSSHTLDTVLTTDCETPTERFNLRLVSICLLQLTWGRVDRNRVTSGAYILMLPSNVRKYLQQILIMIPQETG